MVTGCLITSPSGDNENFWLFIETLRVQVDRFDSLSKFNSLIHLKFMFYLPNIFYFNDLVFTLSSAMSSAANLIASFLF